MNKENLRISSLNTEIYELSKRIRILTHIGWRNEIREEFFRNNANVLPEVEYPEFEANEIVNEIEDIQKQLGDTPVDDWLYRQGQVLSTSAKMLASTGSSDFYKFSRELYGSPDDPLADGASTSLGLAQQFDSILETFNDIDLGAPPPACHLAETVADEIRNAVDEAFGEDAPEVFVVDELSANALAGAKRIRIRKSACFTDRDIVQLIHHEAFIHVATSLNGLAQEQLPMLLASHAGTTRTQEGLAVFAEFITGSMDLDRMRRLSDRILGVKMAIDGADFIEVYRFFNERLSNQEQAFENTRRVFRGGVMSGGAPFTKDIVYIDGLLRIHNFFRAIVSGGRADCIPLLFCGKLNLDDVPIISELINRGLCKMPKYLPAWAKDRRFLLSYLAYSSFLNSIDMTAVSQHYEEMLTSTPKLSPE